MVLLVQACSPFALMKLSRLMPIVSQNTVPEVKPDMARTHLLQVDMVVPQAVATAVSLSLSVHSLHPPYLGLGQQPYGSGGNQY